LLGYLSKVKLANSFARNQNSLFFSPNYFQGIINDCVIRPNLDLKFLLSQADFSAENFDDAGYVSKVRKLNTNNMMNIVAEQLKFDYF